MGKDVVAAAFEIGMLQIESEIRALYEFVRDLQPRNVLEIGSNTGGSFYLWCQIATGKKISVDWPGGPYGSISVERGKQIEEAMKGWAPAVRCVRGNSRSPSALLLVKQILDGESLDFLFIDGDHTYEGIKADYENYNPLVKPGGWIALHDIVDSAQHRAAGCMVSRLWDELAGEKKVIGATDQWGGIGLVRKSS